MACDRERMMRCPEVIRHAARVNLIWKIESYGVNSFLLTLLPLLTVTEDLQILHKIKKLTIAHPNCKNHLHHLYIVLLIVAITLAPATMACFKMEQKGKIRS